MGNSKLYKGSLTTIILNLLSDEGQMYGYEITQKVRALTKGEIKITEGALYPALHKLKANGLLETHSVKVDNRLRKYYKLTKKGHKESLVKLKELQSFIDNMQIIMNPNFKLS